MKKIGLICATALLGMSLTACGSQSSNKDSSSSKMSSSKVVKHHKKSAKKQTKKNKARQNASSNSSSANNSSSQQGNQQSQNKNSNGTQQASSNNGNGQLPPSSDLHDFVNRYGESPAAYLTDHYGMSPEQAVQSVPNDMKSSGEIQDTYQLQQGQDPFNQ
ncbi:hypothetical protein [Limosilactobacillus vaginalis]|uniref:hypothetical protein n=1 Tax=Limosilactobacillus vaginalis TaxID=1633 RepID=UPI00174ABE02|nr:hypothetical protein [Limosilactobacillus vaginalis]